MKEQALQSIATRKAHEATMQARRSELAPLLAQVALEAKRAYTTLIPMARAERSLGAEATLRYAPVYGVGRNSEFILKGHGVVVDFDEQHKLVLRANLRSGSDEPKSWHFRSVLPKNSYRNTEIVLEEPELHPGFDPSETINFQAFSVALPNSPNRAPGFRQAVSGRHNGYRGAEDYLASLEADIKDALSRFVF